MTRRPHGWRLGVLAIASMLLMLVAPAIRVSAQADAATEFGTVVGQLATMTPVAGPLSGSLDAANADSAPAGVSVANGVAHAEFTVPNVNAGTLWAMAVLFRVTDAGQNFLLIFPDGTWQLDNGQGGAAVSGTGATFDTTPGTAVAVDVLFDGATGAFGLNGTFVSALDLTAVQGAGDVELTGYLGLGAGATTLDYSNFSVYDLAGGSPAPTATTGGVIGAPTETATTAGLPVETPTAAAGLPTVAGLPTTAATTAAPTTTAGGDPAALFSQYLAQENSQPIVYGPESGTLVHDPEKVTFLDTGVSVTDFGAHIECAAPRTAAELWDCGLAFRDTSSPNHYRLGVVSDGHWFLSIGNGDPLQSGEGIPIPPNTGDKVALDLIVIGNTGYFGVDGTFVSELDLSALPGPGSVSAVIGFFNETYVAGGQTPYEDFVIWSFDQGGATPSETAVVGVPTTAPTVALPPVQTPTTAGLPVETPTTVAGLPTETPAALPTTAAGTSNVVGNTYTSPTFGYQLTWDPTWSVVTDSSQNQFDVLRITNGVVTTDLYSGVSSMSLQECISSLVSYYQGNASYANVVQVPFPSGETILTQGNVATAILTFDYTDDSGVMTPTTDTVICVSMPTQGALVTMESYIPTDQVAAQQAAVSALQAQLVVDGAPVVLPPVPVTGGVPTQAAGAPTQAVPTVAAPASETAVANPSAAANTSHVVGNTYTSPTYGYQLTWDPTWSVELDFSSDQLDVLRLTNGVVETVLSSDNSSTSVEECITSQIGSGSTLPGQANFALVPFADGQTIHIQGNVATAVLTLDVTNGTVTTPTTGFLTCVAMGSGDVFVSLSNYVPTDQVESQSAAIGALNSQLVVDGAPVVLPSSTVTAPTASETAVTAVGTSASFTLSPVGGSSVSGIGTLSSQARTVNVMALTTNAEPGSAVGIAHGSCAELATVLEPDYYVGDTTETGIVQGTVPVSLSVLLTRGPYSVVVYGPGDGAPMVACGEITG